MMRSSRHSEPREARHEAAAPRESQTPEGLGALVKADAEKWWPLIKKFGIKAE